MSQAQAQTAAALRSNFDTSNEAVLEHVRRMPGGCGTYTQVINSMAGTDAVDPVRGNAICAPIIRALSELATEGLLDSSETAINPDTGRPNTLYRYVQDPGTAAPRRQSWKQKYEELLAEIKVLRIRSTRVVQVERENRELRAQIESLTESLRSYNGEL